MGENSLTGFRPDHDTYFIMQALVAATRGSCARRKTGCVLVDKNNHVLSTGYNGPPSNVPNCVENKCAGAEFASGHGLDACIAVHAEQNALLQCKDVQKINFAYCTTEPCIHCTKLLMNTSCSQVIFFENYPHSAESKVLWYATKGSTITHSWFQHNTFFLQRFNDMLNEVTR